jgi:hypothetical protein
VRGARDRGHKIQPQEQLQKVEARYERFKDGMSTQGEQQREEQPGETVLAIAAEHDPQHVDPRPLT